MKDRNKYFVFNKESDFTRGYLHNITYTPQGIRIADTHAKERAVFYSRVLDSRERETLWHRIVIDSKSIGDASIRFTFYAGDERTISYGGKVMDVGDFINSPDISFDEKEKALEAQRVKQALNPVDVLLCEARGRYLWFKIELLGQGEESPEISRIKIYINNSAWTEYLPEIYQTAGGSFTQRYLSIFQSIYDDMEEKLDRLAARFDVNVAEGEMLRWLAGWIDVDDVYIWPEEKLRYLIENGISIYKRRGTRSSVSDMIELYTGQKPYIIEHFQTEGFMDNDKIGNLYDQLYGESAYQFTVVINEECAPTPKEYKTLIKILEGIKPAHIEANLVVLKPYIFLNKYSYLGMNSVLGQYRPANLDGFSVLPFTNVTEAVGK